MQDNIDSQKPVRSHVTKANVEDLIQQLLDDNSKLLDDNSKLLDDNSQLRQMLKNRDKVIDEITNTVAMQSELVQQLRDEIAILKKQKPKPKIPPSTLENQNPKGNQQGGKSSSGSGKPGRPGQPKGKPRKKKKTILQIHDKPIIRPYSPSQ